MISKGSRETENWSNDNWKLQNYILKYIQLKIIIITLQNYSFWVVSW